MSLTRIGITVAGLKRPMKTAGNFLFSIMLSALSQVGPALSQESGSGADSLVRDTAKVWPKTALDMTPLDWLGEEMEYGVYFGFIPAGKAKLAVVDTARISGELVVRAVSSARSARAYDVIFKVRDSIETWMDADSIYSHQFRKQLREGKYRDEKVVKFDQSRQTVNWWDDGESRPVIYVQPGVHDVLASGFKARTLPFAVGDTFYIKTHDVNKSYDLMVMVLGTETVDCVLGDISCYKCEPVFRSGGLFKKERGARVFVWVTADDRRIPVKVSSRVSFGSFSAVLDRYVPPRSTQ